jgi:putative acetyltransferase
MLRLASVNDFDFIYQLYMHPQANRYLLYDPMDKKDFLPVFLELQSKEQLYVYENSSRRTGMCKLVPQQYRDAHKVYLGGWPFILIIPVKGKAQR